MKQKKWNKLLKKIDMSIDAYFGAEASKQKLNLMCFDCDESLHACTCIHDTIDMDDTTCDTHDSINCGAKWQQERMYSEHAIQHVLDGFTVNASGEYIKTNFMELLKKAT